MPKAKKEKKIIEDWLRTEAVAREALRLAEELEVAQKIRLAYLRGKQDGLAIAHFFL